MRVGLNVLGAAELARVLNGLGKGVRKSALYDVLKYAAEPMRARMAQAAPRRPPAPDLADNIVISPTSRIGSVAGGRWQAADEFQAAVAVGPSSKFQHGIFLEYGTVHMSAQAFGRPAFDGTADRCLDLIREGLWALVVKHVGVLRVDAPVAMVSAPGGTGVL